MDPLAAAKDAVDKARQALYALIGAIDKLAELLDATPVGTSTTTSTSTTSSTTSDTTTTVAPTTSTTSTTTTTTPPMPPSGTVVAVPDTIFAGQTVTLTWTLNDDYPHAELFGVELVGRSGHMNVTPIESTTYTLTAANQGGTFSVSAFVTVLAPTTTTSTTTTTSSTSTGTPTTQPSGTTSSTSTTTTTSVVSHDVIVNGPMRAQESIQFEVTTLNPLDFQWSQPIIPHQAP